MAVYERPPVGGTLSDSLEPRKDPMITTDALSPAHHDAVRDLLDAVTAHDGISPLDEAARLALVGGTAQHLLSPVDFGNGTDHALSLIHI